jgi:hypothetical protein
MRNTVVLSAALAILSANYGAQDGLTCDCSSNTDRPISCLTETQMIHQVKHIEMEPDRMGNHVNVSGIAVFNLIVGEDGRILNAQAISGHPLALPLLIEAMDKWRFKPFVGNHAARRVCGRLSVKFSIVQNLPKVAVVRP